MKETFNKLIANKPLQWFIIAAAVLAVVYWYGKTSITDTLKYDHPLPSNGTTLPTGWATQASELADKLYNVLDGIWTFAKDKELVFVVLMSLNDDQIVSLYNVYNKKYCTDNRNTSFNRTGWN